MEDAEQQADAEQPNFEVMPTPEEQDAATFPETLWSRVLAAVAARQENTLRMREYRVAHVPRDLGQLRTLTVLDLSFNLLESLPDALGDLAQLRELLVDHNRLASLPPALGRLKQLVVFHVHANQLRWLPAEMLHLSNVRFFKHILNPWESTAVVVEPAPVASLCQLAGTVALRHGQTPLLADIEERLGTPQVCSICCNPFFQAGSTGTIDRASVAGEV